MERDARDREFRLSFEFSGGVLKFSAKFFTGISSGNQIPKAITHTCLILIPKVECPQTFNELRPISLNNFSCTIISSLINKKLSLLMDKLIFPNQTSFIKGRSIIENIILTQDIVHNISKSSPVGNVILKLDMVKAYDRVSWEYLCEVLRKLSFNEKWTDCIWRLMNNVWYSVNINGSRHDFFNSSRGLKQGNPLSPSLFLIRAELLSKLMDSLICSDFIPYFSDDLVFLK
ncbi:hypothetical protein P3S67_021687 [Capsicum chacoense]